MDFYEDIILSLEQMEKGEVESLIFRCYENFRSVRMIFRIDAALAKLNSISLDEVKSEIWNSFETDESVSWKRSSEYEFVMVYVEKSFQRYVEKRDFDIKIKKEILLKIINAAKEKGMQIQERYYWFEKLEEMADFYNENYAAPGEPIDPHP